MVAVVILIKMILGTMPLIVPLQVGIKLVTMLTHPEAVECIRLVKID